MHPFSTIERMFESTRSLKKQACGGKDATGCPINPTPFVDETNTHQ